MARAIAVLGTGSGVGKSLLVTALARYFARRGLRVAPFKGQNMSNHARVAEGGEIGAAQYYQALAAGVAPEVRMNPVLLKPEAETRSQVVVLGRARPELARVPWRERAGHLWPPVEASLRSLLDGFDLVLIEGAGSPAEPNLQGSDVTNLRVVRAADAAAILVADIDKGGAFAALLGTHALLPEADRSRLVAFVLNKFRGDPALLDPAPTDLWRRTGMAPLGVVPLLAHRLPDEDAPRLGSLPPGGGRRVGVVRYPFAANLDEFGPLYELAGFRWVEAPGDLDDLDLLILPGAKNVAAALDALRAGGLDRAVAAFAGAGRPVIGVCGGLELLGEAIADPDGVEFGGVRRGLGLLPLATRLVPEKRVRRRAVRFRRLAPPFEALAGVRAVGYEIHHGQSRPTGEVLTALPEGLGYQKGNVLGVYLHGLFEDPAVQRALFGRTATGLEATFDALAEAVGEHLDEGFLMAMVERGPAARRTPPGAVYFLLGGARSGKSRGALRLARRLGGDAVTFVATARATDPEMEARIARHRADRPEAWRLVEAPRGFGRAVAEATTPVVVLDCLAVGLANALVEEGEAAALAELAELVAALGRRGRTAIVVSNEVGMGVVPPSPLGRRFRDLLGGANQRLAGLADAVYLFVAGQAVRLKGGQDVQVFDSTGG